MELGIISIDSDEGAETILNDFGYIVLKVNISKGYRESNYLTIEL